MAGLRSGAIVAVRGRAPREGLRCLLDLLLAAGLIRLSTVHSWTAIGLAVATVVVRQIAGRGLRAAASARASAPSARR